MTPCHVKITGSIHVSFKLGKYELRPEVKKLYQLRPEVTASSVSVATRVVNPKHDELRPVVSKELYQLCPSFSASCILLVFASRQQRAYELHRKIWVFKIPNNFKVLTRFYCTLLLPSLLARTKT